MLELSKGEGFSRGAGGSVRPFGNSLACVFGTSEFPNRPPESSTFVAAGLRGLGFSPMGRPPPSGTERDETTPFPSSGGFVGALFATSFFCFGSLQDQAAPSRQGRRARTRSEFMCVISEKNKAYTHFVVTAEKGAPLSVPQSSPGCDM